MARNERSEEIFLTEVWVTYNFLGKYLRKLIVHPYTCTHNGSTFVPITLVEMQNLEQDKPDEPVYQGQSDVYRLLKRDGKPANNEHWEPPSYQGLTKEATQGAWGERAVYTNPSMYQELKKNETTSNENLPAYHPLVKQQQYAVR